MVSLLLISRGVKGRIGILCRSRKSIHSKFHSLTVKADKRLIEYCVASEKGTSRHSSLYSGMNDWVDAAISHATLPSPMFYATLTASFYSSLPSSSPSSPLVYSRFFSSERESLLENKRENNEISRYSIPSENTIVGNFVFRRFVTRYISWTHWCVGYSKQGCVWSHWHWAELILSKVVRSFICYLFSLLTKNFLKSGMSGVSLRQVQVIHNVLSNRFSLFRKNLVFKKEKRQKKFNF